MRKCNVRPCKSDAGPSLVAGGALLPALRCGVERPSTVVCRGRSAAVQDVWGRVAAACPPPLLLPCSCAGVVALCCCGPPVVWAEVGVPAFFRARETRRTTLLAVLAEDLTPAFLLPGLDVFSGARPLSGISSGAIGTLATCGCRGTPWRSQ